MGTLAVPRGWQGWPYFSVFEFRCRFKFCVSGDPLGSERVAWLAIL